MNIAPLQGKLRVMYDTIESYYRGLNALRASPESYQGIVVPMLVENLPIIILTR